MTQAHTATARPAQGSLVGLVSGDSFGSLPDDFTIEVSERYLVRLGFCEAKAMQQSWVKTRAELIRRGYEVREWTDPATMTQCARCVKPNDKLTDAGTKTL